jgi:hypothetical protein
VVRDGHTVGTPATEDVAAQGPVRRTADRQSAAPAGWPRLMPVLIAAQYVGLSPWVLEQYIADGTLAVIRPPRPRTAKAMRPRRSKGRKPSAPIGEHLRRVLIDREDLERLADEWRRRA